MNHVEFVGAPGAGKTSISASLTDRDGWYRPTTEETCRREFLQGEKLKYRLCYLAAPSSVRSFFQEQLLTYRYQHRAHERFGEQHPGALREILTGAGAVEHQPDKIARLLKMTIERYQLGLDTVRRDERLCLDEGFRMRAASILWRRPSDGFSLERYLRHTPTPEVLVHVRAPPEVCLDRQADRERMGISESWTGEDLYEEQARFIDVCEKVADEQHRRTTVLTIDNTGTVEEAVDRIERSLPNTRPTDDHTQFPGDCGWSTGGYSGGNDL